MRWQTGRNGSSCGVSVGWVLKRARASASRARGTSSDASTGRTRRQIGLGTAAGESATRATGVGYRLIEGKYIAASRFGGSASGRRAHACTALCLCLCLRPDGQTSERAGLPEHAQHCSDTHGDGGWSARRKVDATCDTTLQSSSLALAACVLRCSSPILTLLGHGMG